MSAKRADRLDDYFELTTELEAAQAEVERLAGLRAQALLDWKTAGGWTLAQVADLLGVHRTRVFQMLKEARKA